MCSLDRQRWLLVITLLRLVFTSHAVVGEELRRFGDARRPVIGRPIYWDPQEQVAHVLTTDGTLQRFSLDAVRASEKINGSFRSQTQGEMRSALIAEFGPAFEVTGTGNYLVVHPKGEGRVWASRFEDLYRQMIRYFNVRGINTQPPPFPMVAIVFPTQHDFFQNARQRGINLSPSVMGYYSHETNRIQLYDVTAGGRVGADWRVNAETIVHEAAHQTAFNVGIHSRFALPPRWIAEGLGTLFEAPGIYDSVNHGELRDRINREQLRAYRRRVDGRLPAGTLRALVAADTLFQAAPESAYAVSWALTFLLSEQEPQNLARYLQLTAGYAPFSQTTPMQRWHDFQSCFGRDDAMLESRLHRFMESIAER